MSRNNGRDYIYLIWKDFETRQRFTIGELSKNCNYQFRYFMNNLNLAVEKGFEPLIAFPNVNEVYESKEIFPAFSSRLPDRRRKDIKEILEKYKVEKYDAFELLKKSGGKLPTDSLEFIDPIFLEEKNIEREFFVAGVRNYEYCENSDKNIYSTLNINEKLNLRREIDNSYDKYAIKILTRENKIIGYIPNYFSKEVMEAVENNRKITCTLVGKECNDICEECIKVKICIR